MKNHFSRRDFLKLAGAVPLGLAASKAGKAIGLKPAAKNVVIVVFDALSALHMPLFGYGRDTAPNISRLAERAVVYHQHYAGSNFTTPGTATLLTGAHAWTHRALNPNGGVAPDYADRSIFSCFKDHRRVAYSHNEWVNTLFDQFQKDIDEWIPREQLTLFSSDRLIQKIFANDRDIASVGWVRNIKIQQEGYAYSLFLSRLVAALEEGYSAEYKSQFPRGLPTARADGGFLLEHAIDGLAERIRAATEPVFGYFHFLPPHDPYRTRRDFAGRFRNDGYVPASKPVDIFAKDQDTDADTLRQYYDEFILYADHEFGRLVDLLESAGEMENTILVLTSDHGEMFERGIAGHVTDAMREPLLRVPLLIFDPDIKEPIHIHTPTSAIDLLPTLAQLAGYPAPQWGEGSLLPPYAEAVERSVFAVRSYNADGAKPLTQASATLVRGRYKLHYYFGYAEIDGGELIYLYDLQDDPDEMKDLAQELGDLAGEMLAEVKEKIRAADEKYAQT